MKFCLVGNLNELDECHSHYLTDCDVSVLASTTSSINSCLIEDSRLIADCDKCVVIISERYAKYSSDDFGNKFAITPDSQFSEICFFKSKICKLSLVYNFRLFLELYFYCKSLGQEVIVLDKSKKQAAEEYIQDMLTVIGEPRAIDSRNGYVLYDMYNSSNEFIQKDNNKDNLVISLGDSWPAGDNQDISSVWHAGMVQGSFGDIVAEYYDSDFVVCASPGNSNQGAVINFWFWLLHNQDTIKRYKSVKLIISQTTYTRDFTAASGTIGNWSHGMFLEYILSQTDEKLITDSVKSIETCIRICNQLSIDVILLRSHGKELNDYIRFDNVVKPYEYSSYDYMFKYYPDMLSSCGHPSIKGHRFLAQEIINYMEGKTC